MLDFAAVVLAAGVGTRMRSSRAKVLHPVAGRPMVAWVMDAVRRAGVGEVVVVVGHQAEQVRQALGDSPAYVVQEELLGTGHALLQARPLLEGKVAQVLLVHGDIPLLRPETLGGLMGRHSEARPAMTVLTCSRGSPGRLGRVLRDAAGRVQAIVESDEASPEQAAIAEWNTGVYVLEEEGLWGRLERLVPRDKGEFYLTDLVAMAVGDGKSVAAVQAEDPAEVSGVNTRVELARAEQVAQERLRIELMLVGVTMEHPQTVYLHATAKVAEDTVIHPNSHIYGRSEVGPECDIGPGAFLLSARIGRGCRIVASYVEDSVLEDGVAVGPFSRIRGGSVVRAGATIGNYAELKKTVFGSRSKAMHFCYLGDATVGEDVNIGAGTITANFDGVTKHPTVIGDRAFIGTDTVLVAPVEVGPGAVTGAGSVVTHDVPANTVVYGVPARVRRQARSLGP